MLVDEMHLAHPDLKFDVFMDQEGPAELPHTEASKHAAGRIMVNSAADVELECNNLFSTTETSSHTQLLTIVAPQFSIFCVLAYGIQSRCGVVGTGTSDGSGELRGHHRVTDGLPLSPPPPPPSLP